MGSGPLCRKVEAFQDHSVVDFIVGGVWNVQLLSQVLEPELVQQVVCIVPPLAQGRHRLIWVVSTNGEFSIASAYSVVR